MASDYARFGCEGLNLQIIREGGHFLIEGRWSGMSMYASREGSALKKADVNAKWPIGDELAHAHFEPIDLSGVSINDPAVITARIIEAVKQTDKIVRFMAQK